MTKKQAIHILIKHAAKNCTGAGCGPGHRIPSPEEQERVALAILKIWPEKYYGPNWFNLGLRDPRTETKKVKDIKQ